MFTQHPASFGNETVECALPNIFYRTFTTEDTGFHRGTTTEVNHLNLSVHSRFGAVARRHVHLTLRRQTEGCLCSGMNSFWKISLCILLLHFTAVAASKPHVVTLGRWTSISVHSDETAKTPTAIKIRPLYVDGRSKEFTVGTAHDVTERTFVVQRIYRVNDSLPQQSGPTQWQWQRGGWLLVDRVSGKVQQIALAEFDPDSAAVNWFRDYAAYCGISDEGQKMSAVIMQIGRRKPLLKKFIGDSSDSHPACAPPVWDRDPVRVTFAYAVDQKLTFSVKSRAVGAITSDESEGGE
jgi:hypothetical protein